VGIAKDSYHLLARLSKIYKFEDKEILTLGRQSGILTFRQMRKVIQILELEGYYQGKGIEGFDLYRAHPSDTQIFQSLGFGKLFSLDSNDYEGATLIHDLNLPILGDNSFGQFDVVFDGGTSEHIFDQMQVLENLHKLCKIGGLIIHYTPANNFLDHGYVQPSPSFYKEYYEANHYELVQTYLVESKADWVSKRAVFNYESLAFEFVSFGGHWSRRMLGNWFVVKKKESSTSKRIPQQLRSTINYVLQENSEPFRGFLRVIQDFLHNHPNLRYLVLRFRELARRLGWLVRNHLKRRPKPNFYV